MLFGRRDKKKSNERVLDLKARVDALRAADESTREKPYSLDHFLEGDDVLTGRAVQDAYTPTGFDASSPGHASAEASFEANLQAELDKYIRRQEELGKAPESDVEPLQPVPLQAPETSNARARMAEDWGLPSAPQQSPEAPAMPATDAAWGTAPGSPQASGWDTAAWPETNRPASEEPPRHDEAV